MKVLITGASGLLGRAFAREFADLDPVTCAWSRAGENDLKLDLTDADAVRSVLSREKPDLIIHSAAERRPDACENERDATAALNVSASRVIAEASAEIGAQTLYISTDYVFDGRHPPYAVDAERGPLNYYGHSKMEGEDATLNASSDHLVLRVPILYGAVESPAESAVTILLNELLDKRPRKIDHWAIRYPTLVDDVARTVRGILDRIKGLSGVYHFSGAEALTKYEMVVEIAKRFELPHDHLTPDDHPTPGAPRPRDCQLDVSRLEQITNLSRTPFREGIEAALRPFIPTTEDQP